VTGPTLEQRLASAGSRLSERAVAEMYKDPFWSARFGERGRVHAGRDGEFHLEYLVEALAARDAGVFEHYARWLREVLVSRGMCSLHLAENFDRLARAIDDEGWPDRRRAIDTLRAGARVLVHLTGDAGVLDAARAQLVATAAAPLDGVRPVDLEHYLSFLADALAFGRRELFVKHVTFAASIAPRRDVLGAALDRLAAAIAELATSGEPARYLAAARAVVSP
jgi:hypothetical protein